MCFGCWVLGILFDLPNFLGWGSHDFDFQNHSCIWNRTARFVNNMFNLSIWILNQTLTFPINLKCGLILHKRLCSLSYTIILATVFFGGPLLLMTGCYIEIFFTIRRARRVHITAKPNPRIIIEFAVKGQQIWNACKTIFFVFLGMSTQLVALRLRVYKRKKENGLCPCWNAPLSNSAKLVKVSIINWGFHKLDEISNTAIGGFSMWPKSNNNRVFPK